jgi:hypothetical protein
MEPADADAYFGRVLEQGIRAGVHRALIILWSDVLDQRGILLDDRRPCFEDWLDGKLDELTPGIAGEVQTWLRSLRDGGPSARPRTIATVWHYANALRPTLLEWSANYDHLREVGRDDVLTALDSRHGTHRPHTLIALRSLVGFSKKNGVVFRNPPATLERLRVDRQLEEALTHGLDPLHLAVVFGLDEKTAIRYAPRHAS